MFQRTTKTKTAITETKIAMTIQTKTKKNRQKIINTKKYQNKNEKVTKTMTNITVKMVVMDRFFFEYQHFNF